MDKIKLLLIACLMAQSSLAAANQAADDMGDPNCDSLLLVSSWTRNNVKIYDGCSGEFVRDLDTQGLFNGPLGILQSPDGDVLVASENNSRLLKFDKETLSQGSVYLGDDPDTSTVEDNLVVNPATAVIKDGFMYAASFTQNNVVKIDLETKEIVDEILPVGVSLIEGIDVGMSIGEDGYLYLPGFYSNNVVRINLSTKVAEEVVAKNAGSLSGTRTIIVRDTELVVSSELSGAIKLYDKASGDFIQDLATVSGPTGMQQDDEQHIIFNTSTAVYRMQNDGSNLEKIVQSGAGSLVGGVFVYRFQKVTSELDTDNDGLTDEDEANIHGTDPEDSDTDDDTLSDGDEVNTHNTNPLLGDSDSDGMPDGFEVNYSLLPNEDDADEDFDVDGLSNLDEFLAGTEPNNDDTDGDGEKDGVDSDPLVPNTAPEVSGVPTTSLDQDEVYSFQPQVTYAGDLSTITLTISNKPDWASFDSSNAMLSGTPGNSDVGTTSDIKISASNSAFDVDLTSFDIEVININDAPVLTRAISDQSIIIGNSISLNVSSNFDEIDTGDSLTFSATGLPAGLSISSEGIVSGTAIAINTSSVTVTATDLSGASANDSFSISINEEEKSGGGSQSIWTLILLIFVAGRYRSKLSN